MACGSMPAFSQGKASSAVVSTLKYWVLGFWNTLPTCGTIGFDGGLARGQPAAVQRPVRVPG